MTYTRSIEFLFGVISFEKKVFFLSEDHAAQASETIKIKVFTGKSWELYA